MTDRGGTPVAAAVDRRDVVRKRFYARPPYDAAVSGVSPRNRSTSGPYRPSRDPQILLLVGIVAAVVGLWVVGVMSPAALVGGESGPVFPFRDQSEEGQVELSLNASTVDPGDAVEVSVTVDGDPASDATVAVAGDEYATDADGVVVIRLDSPGSYDVEATAPGTNRSATATLHVRRYERALSVEVPNSAETAESVPVRVTAANGTPVAASVTAGGETRSTGPDGVANVTFETAGVYTVTASKSPTDRYRFTDATADVTIDRRDVRLAVATNRTAPTVDDPVALSVTRRDTGDPVNATVALPDRTASTGEDGRVTVRFDRGGSIRVTASANRTDAVRFVPGERRVDVQRIPVALAVTVTPDPLEENERATFVVRRNDTGERVPAHVTLYGTTYATDRNGTVSFPFYVPGNVTVTASKDPSPRERYVNATATFLVDGPEIEVESLEIPERAPADGEVTITATLSNVGTVDYASNAVVAVGSATTRVETSVAAGETRTVEWTVATPAGNGTVPVTIDYEEVAIERTLSLESGNDSNATAIEVSSPVRPAIAPADRAPPGAITPTHGRPPEIAGSTVTPSARGGCPPSDERRALSAN